MLLGLITNFHAFTEINSDSNTTHKFINVNIYLKAEHEETMPNYFGFLTVMALHVFLQEGVDVAILEVGIGGQYDCTNMVR